MLLLNLLNTFYVFLCFYDLMKLLSVEILLLSFGGICIGYTDTDFSSLVWVEVLHHGFSQVFATAVFLYNEYSATIRDTLWSFCSKMFQTFALFAYDKEMQRHPAVFTYPQLCTRLSFFSHNPVFNLCLAYLLLGLSKHFISAVKTAVPIKMYYYCDYSYLLCA